MNNIELLSRKFDNIEFKWFKVAGGNSYCTNYNLKVFNNGSNITDVAKDLIGKYDTDTNSLLVTTSNIDQTCCYIIECIYDQVTYNTKVV